jgi:hypothetical protein
MEICMQTSLLSLLLNLVLSVGNVILPIEDLMVDGGCIATTGGRRLFCYQIYYMAIYEYKECLYHVIPLLQERTCVLIRM